jgi:hypothetical protein
MLHILYNEDVVDDEKKRIKNESVSRLKEKSKKKK